MMCFSSHEQCHFVYITGHVNVSQQLQLLKKYFLFCNFQSILSNLTQELNETELISNSRLQQVESVLVVLEETAADNQVEVDILSEKVPIQAMGATAVV